MENSVKDKDLSKCVSTMVAFVKDEDNNIKQFNSVIYDKINGIEKEPTNQEIKDEIIKNIENVSFKIGLFSSRMYSYCDFDNVSYTDDNIISKRLLLGEMIGFYTPYDLIVYHKSNEWKFRCLNVEFELFQNLISIMNTTFPRIINIKRSNGSIQKGLIPKNGGFIVRKSKSLGDLNDRIYIRITFDENNESEVSDEYIYNLKSYKDIPLENIIEINPEITEFTINHYLFTNQEYKEESKLTKLEIKNSILEYYDNKKKYWILDKLNPIIDSLKEKVNIKNIIH